MKSRFTLFIALLILFGHTHLFSQSKVVGSQPDPQKENLMQMAERFHQRFLDRRAELEKVSIQKGWTLRKETATGVSEIQFIDQSGFPQAYTTNNLNAGRTTNTDDIWSGGSTGLNLTGAGYTVGEWDAGGVLTTHQEFDNGAGARVTQIDGAATTHYHSTHVAGTIVGEGQVASAHGMATAALLHAYDWTDDEAEMATAASGGLTLSNHSYGFIRGWYSDGTYMYWYGNPTISATEDYQFGFYDASSQDWDNIAYNAPGYLIVKSAGNDRGDAFTGGHYFSNGTSWVYSTATRDADGGADGYDCIEQRGVAKNVLTVGAVNAIPGGWTSPASVVMSSFSGWGPTDDGRIKPDIVADGVGVYSTHNTGNANYLTLDGTSMSTPNVTGSLVLLQDYYKTLRGGTMSAAALKGLVINTANEAGSANGPDYIYGWGLMNASGAANLITTDNTQGGQIVQSILNNGQTVDYTFYSNGTIPANVTLCWTDPAGTPVAASLNPTTAMLVNDLDLRVIGTFTYYPWILNPAAPASAATTGDNFRDNVEKVTAYTPAAGYYTIRVSHKGSLSGGSQAYALVVSGMTALPGFNYCSARATGWAYDEHIGKVVMGSISNSTGRSPGGFGDYTGLVNQFIKGTTQTLTVTINNGFASDYGRVWFDWNQDGDFADAGEEYNLGSGTGPTYSINVAAPMTAVPGYTTMRVRLAWSGYPTSCGVTSYGETEDYSIRVMSGCPASGGCDEYISRVQAGTIDNSSACSNYFDYTATQSTNLPVNGIIHATITNGVPLYFQDQCGIWVDWNRDGDFTDVGETVAVTGSPGVGPYTAAIVPPAGTTLGMCTMRVRITYTGAVSPCGSTTYGEVEDYTINVTSLVPNYWTGAVSTEWHNPLNWSLEHVPTAAEDTYITNLGFQPAIVNTFNEDCKSLIVSTGGAAQVVGSALTVHQDVVIYGALSMTDAAGTIFVAGNWYNTVGAAGFSAGPGRVTFNGGAYHQYCSDETFNLLEVNKPLGGAFRMSGTYVSCAAYDWTAGAVDVLSGSFTASDLIDNGVYGAFYCNAGGAINLTNSGTGTWVDLNGELHIYGGTVTLDGTDSFWSFASDAVFEMSGGILDFPNCSMVLGTGHNLTSNVTGGTVMIAKGFNGARADFVPTGGTFEFYGPTDAYIYQFNGSTLYNVVINKVVSKSAGIPGEITMQNERTGLAMSPGSLNNSIILATNIAVTNNLTISSGSYILNGNTATVGHYTTVNGSLVMTNAADVFNAGTTNFDHLEFTTGSSSTLTAGTINPASFIWCSGAANITSSPAAVINFTGTNFGGIEVDGPGSVFGTVNLNKTAGYPTIAYSTYGNAVELLGGLNFSPGNELNFYNSPSTTMIVHGSVVDNATSSFTAFGNLVIYPDFTLNGTMNIGSGNVTLHGNFHTESTSTIYITTGSLVCDLSAPYTWMYLDGHLSMSGGLFELTHSNFNLNNTATTAISGGVIRASGAFGAYYPGTFQPTGGTVELGSSLANYIISTDPSCYFHNLTINHVTFGSNNLLSDITVNNALTVNGGTLNLLGYTCNINGTVAVNNGGVLSVGNNAILKMNNLTTLNVNIGGRLYAISDPGNVGTISRISTGYYSFNVQSGGTIAARNCTFEYMDGNGVHLQNGSLVDPAYAFTNCTFQNGSAGGTLLTANNSQTMQVHNAIFPANGWGGASNVRKDVNAGHVYFVDFDGPFSGETYDNDGFNRVDWVPTLTASASATPATICAGYSSQLNMAATGGLAPLTYIWSPSTGLSNPNIANPVASPATTTTYSVTVTDQLGTAVTGSVMLTVNPSSPVSVSIAASANPSPPGNFVLFMATPVNGGPTPIYQWKVNGINVGSGLSTYSYVPANNDHVTCTLTSSLATCFFPAQALSNTITMVIVPANTSVIGNVPAPLSLCFDASNVITVAGGGTTFHVASGASATMIAGQKIRYLYGTSVSPGGYMHGYITLTNSYCASLPPSMVSILAGEEENQQPVVVSQQSFRVYPNPTSGEFTVEATGHSSNLISQITVFNLSGAKVFTVDLKGERNHHCSLSGLPTGIYFIHVTTGKETGVSKLIKL